MAMGGKRGPDGELRIVLMRVRDSEDRQDGVTNELLGGVAEPSRSRYAATRRARPVDREHPPGRADPRAR